jgi:hypothetical protein
MAFLARTYATFQQVREGEDDDDPSESRERSRADAALAGAAR